MVLERQHGAEAPFPLHLRISEHAEERMSERDVIVDDLFEILLDDPCIQWDGEQGGMRTELMPEPRRLRMIGRGLQRRLLTVILEPPDEGGLSVVVTVFDADPTDERRYRAFKRRRRAT